MAKAPRTAATPSAEPADAPQAGQEAPAAPPQAPEHRTTVPVAPRGPLNPETQAAVAAVRASLLGAAYTTDLGDLRVSREIAASVRPAANVSPEGLEYRAEALDYLDGRIARVSALLQEGQGS